MIDQLPDAPDPANDIPTVFSQKAAAMVLAQRTMVPQINNTVANLNSLAAGGAYSIQYTFVASTSPIGFSTGGKLALEDGKNATTTARVFIDTKDVSGTLVTALLNDFNSSSSTVRGALRLQKIGDPTKWARFNVTGFVLQAGGLYGWANVVPMDSSSSSPFADGDSVMMFFQRTGDKGDPGPNSAISLLTSATISSAVSVVDFLSLFSSSYDKYTVEFEGVKTSSGGASMSFAVGGSVDSAASYCQPVSPGTTVGALSTAAVIFGAPGSLGFTGTLELRNTLGTSSLKGIGIRGSLGALSSGAVLGEGYYGGTSAPSGFRLSGNFTSGVIRVYGHKNS